MNQNTENTYQVEKNKLMRMIDCELVSFEQMCPMQKRDSKFFDDLESMTELRNCLESISISEHALDTLNGQDADILPSIYDYWKRTINNRSEAISREQKVYDTVIEWLSQVDVGEKQISNGADVPAQPISLKKQLYAKAWEEYQAYIIGQSIKAPFDIIGSANVIADYALIMNAIEEGRFSSNVAKMLLTLENPLEAIYEAYQELDISVTQEEMLDEAIQTVADDRSYDLTDDEYENGIGPDDEDEFEI